MNIDQLKKRAERFGMNVSSVSQKASERGAAGTSSRNLPDSALSWFCLSLFQIEEDEKLKKRKERFGALTNAGSAGAADVEVRVTSATFPHAVKSDVKEEVLSSFLCFSFSGEEDEARGTIWNCVNDVLEPFDQRTCRPVSGILLLHCFSFLSIL